MNGAFDMADGPDLSQSLPDNIMALFKQGRSERTVILPGTERSNKGVGLYAETYVEIGFGDENNMLNCIKLLHWSDQRLAKLPDLLALWDWQKSEREGMKIHFSTGWYDKDYFEARKTAFLGRAHASYYEMFGAKISDLKVHHEIK